MDSGGYRAIVVFELAERQNWIPGQKQRIIGRDNNESQYFDCTKDYPLLRNGSIDATVQFGARGRDFRSRRSVNIKAAVNYLLQDGGLQPGRVGKHASFKAGLKSGSSLLRQV